ncbi:SGNH/GDSL hydrolase family protein [Bacillus sp. FJAT-50079]|uniref:SGNH/GDSL hydrolase family protein n=1 Tax=Bacillus sp. FJAT-50079 TaxID=2833577 RepID=UPI001BC8EA2C|nr:SGNH/GDSL hydrolase family protein [Bacillus sp. FJAT-50079]MBS4206719.1 SGNH/GDSL hydrolase family protein [Bacillus sp. FJAT-50079]
MKAFIATIAAIVCAIFLVFSYTYWKDQTTVSSFSEKDSTSNQSPKAETSAKQIDPSLLEKTENWPESARQSLSASLEAGTPYHIAIVGSQALGGEDGWATRLKNEFEETFSKDLINVSIFEFADQTSDQFIMDGGDQLVAESSPDLVLFEPFTLNDNGNVSVEKNHENIMTFLETVKESVVILQPPHPIFNAQIYPGQVNDLHLFANEQNLPYIDHWEVWPDYMTEEIKDYIVEPKQSAPNEKGHELWFTYLKDYFIYD